MLSKSLNISLINKNTSSYYWMVHHYLKSVLYIYNNMFMVRTQDWTYGFNLIYSPLTQIKEAVLCTCLGLLT